jgi:hypothetical protein
MIIFTQFTQLIHAVEALDSEPVKKPVLDYIVAFIDPLVADIAPKLVDRARTMMRFQNDMSGRVGH